MELEKLTLGSLRKAVQDGDTVNGTLMAGQIAGLIRREQTCREIIEETVQQAQECICKMTRCKICCNRGEQIVSHSNRR